MSTYRRGRSEVTVGLYALGSVMVFVLMFGTLTSRGLIRSTRDLYVRLPAANGLLKGDAVLLRGVPVGEVRGIEFGAGGDVVVRAKLHRPVPLTRSATAALDPVDMFGRQAIELRAGPGDSTPLADGDTLFGEPPVGMVDRVDALGRQLERVIGDSTLALVHGALAGVDVAGRGLSAASEDVAVFLAEQSRRMGDVTVATNAVLRNLAAATDPAEVDALRGDLRTAATDLGRAAARMDSASAAAVRMLTGIERGEGSLGRALRDPALYERAVATLDQLERLIADVRTNPGRYVTVKVF